MSPRSPIVWLNGELQSAATARIAPFDRGFTVGCAVFETLRASKGQALAVTRHWRRLVGSCRILGIHPPKRKLFADSLQETLRANQLKDARVRFTITAGDTVNPSPLHSGPPTILVHAVPAPAYTKAEAVITAPWFRNERSAITGAKCASYAENMIALAHAHARGAGEIIFRNTRGELCEGATTNLFVVHDRKVRTPPLESGCLPGVTRQIVLELCRDNDIPCSEVPLHPEALTEADEAFLTSSLRRVQPIAAIDGCRLPKAPGPITRRLTSLYRNLFDGQADP
jgi:branched-chain amino acid aminotransferase